MLRIAFMVVLLSTVEGGAAWAKTVRVMTFNIRCDVESDGINKWANRADDVRDFIEAVAPDLIGMQEVTPGQGRYLKEELEDYESYGVPSEDGKEKGESGMVFFRRSRFRALDKGVFWLSPTPDEPSFGWNAACIRMCTWLKLEDLKTGNVFVFANTHLDHVSEEARREGAGLLKERLAAVAGSSPVILTGDFNCKDTEAAYDVVRLSGFRLEDVHKTAKRATGMRSTYNDWGEVDDSRCYKIDFIFAAPDVEVKRSVVHDSALGGGRYLSDHNPCYADLDDDLL